MQTSRFVFLSLVLAVVATPLTRAGVYVKAAGIYNKPSDIEVSSTTAFKASLKSNTGFDAALGYKMSVFRVEAELQFLRSGTNADTTSGTLLAGTVSTIGAVKETAGFANGYFDFPSYFGFAPYLGAGLGYARVSLEGLGRTRNNVPFTEFSGGDSVFGYQGMIGVQYHIFGTATINVGYRLVERQNIAVRDVVASAQQTLKLGTNRMFELGLAIGF